MTGLAVLAFLMSGFAVCSALALGHMCHVERRQRRFLDRVALSLHVPVDIETGDICRPLLFTLDDVRVCAMLRGDVEVWQLERYDGRLQHASLALVDRDWHAAAEVRAMPTVASLTPRLSVHAIDERSACSLVTHVRADLASLLGRHTRQCVVGNGRAFLEVSRTGLSVDELGDAMMRLHGIICILTGCRVLAPTPPSHQAISGPTGIPIPGVAVA